MVIWLSPYLPKRIEPCVRKTPAAQASIRRDKVAAQSARKPTAARSFAREGASASTSILDGPGGLLAAFGGLERVGELLECGARPWEIESVDFKPVPACVFVQAAAHAAVDLVSRYRVDAAAISEIRVRTFDAALKYPGCDNAGPINETQLARLSLQYAVASVLSRGDLTDANFTDIGNESTHRLLPLIRLEAEPSFTSAFPQRQGAEVEVCMTDRKQFVGRVDAVPSFSARQVIERFRRVATPLLKSDRLAELERTTLSCASLQQVSGLIDLMTTA